MTTHVSTDASTQAIPRVPAAVVALADAAAPEPHGDVPSEQSAEASAPSVQEMYEAGLLKLAALHGRWAAAIAELREEQVMDEPGEAAA